MISPKDKEIYSDAGYGKTTGLSSQANARPAVIVIDVTINFVGDKPEPILESIERYPNSCGEKAWNSLLAIAELLAAARSEGVPVFYSTGAPSGDGTPDSSWAMKKSRTSTLEGNRIPDQIAPEPGDTVIPKEKPSVFFGTPLISHLNSKRVDTLLIAGCTTSGCVRATVVDAFSYGYKVAVVEECVFDRGEVPHKVNLFDMNQKYADVIPLEEARRYLSTLNGGERERLERPVATGRQH